MTRSCGALAAILVCLGGAVAEDRWRPAAAADAVLDGDPWTAGAYHAPVHEDAFVFGDVPSGSAPSPDAIEASVRSDIDLLAQPQRTVDRGSTEEHGLVAWSFGRFSPVGGEGRVYAALDATLGVAGAASAAETQAIVARFAMIADR